VYLAYLAQVLDIGISQVLLVLESIQLPILPFAEAENTAIAMNALYCIVYVEVKSCVQFSFKRKYFQKFKSF